jgi:hypothetical protein
MCISRFYVAITIPEAWYFLKKRSLFSSQIWWPKSVAPASIYVALESDFWLHHSMVMALWWEDTGEGEIPWQDRKPEEIRGQDCSFYYTFNS